MLQSTDLLPLLVPTESSIYDRDVLKGMAQEIVKRIGASFPDETTYIDRRFHASEDVIAKAYQIATVIGKMINSPDSIRLPMSKTERNALVSILVGQLSADSRMLNLLAPVCPDYGEGEAFHSQVRHGVGREAQGAIDAMTTLHQILSEADLPYQATILVADSETDHEDILKKCAGGDRDAYLRDCESNVGLIIQSLQALSLSDTVKCATFSALIQPQFHEKQHEYEKGIAKIIKTDKKLLHEVETIAKERKNRHAQILGRPEQDAELTIRYMAQYAALGEIASQSQTPTVLLNYPTPNIRYFNLRISQETGEKEMTSQSVPVLVSQIKRN
jgi:hypothetical protein